MKLKLKKSEAFKVNDLMNEYNHVCGIDEVGRGPIAGPVVSCALILPKDFVLEEVRDSKKLSDKKRRLLAKALLENCIGVGFGVVDHQMIDDINIKKATHLSMQLAIMNLKDKEGNVIAPDLLLIDAEQIDSSIDEVSIIGGDDTVYQISAASILAKVYRDDMMIEFSNIYPQYSFEAHKGYGTKKHYEAIDQHGICDIHRKSFMKKYFEKKQ
ncbi:MAG: ribonuclease HII [Tissierellia bacterium]|nr:ribonuclease HII [Tissierellia bacterium]